MATYFAPDEYLAITICIGIRRWLRLSWSTRAIGVLWDYKCVQQQSAGDHVGISSKPLNVSVDMCQVQRTKGRALYIIETKLWYRIRITTLRNEESAIVSGAGA